MTFLAHSTGESRTRLIDMLRARVESFDTEVAAKVEGNDPEIRQTSRDLATASQRIVNLSNELESRSWQRVQRDHERARALLIRAEVVGGIVSAITLLVSIWVSFLLPRQVVKPLTDLKKAVDHAAGGNYEIEFEVKGDGEVVELADSVATCSPMSVRSTTVAKGDNDGIGRPANKFVGVVQV